jgi:hypothetical protein
MCLCCIEYNNPPSSYLLVYSVHFISTLLQIKKKGLKALKLHDNKGQPLTRTSYNFMSYLNADETDDRARVSTADLDIEEAQTQNFRRIEMSTIETQPDYGYNDYHPMMDSEFSYQARPPIPKPLSLSQKTQLLQLMGESGGRAYDQSNNRNYTGTKSESIREHGGHSGRTPRKSNTIRYRKSKSFAGSMLQHLEDVRVIKPNMSHFHDDIYIKQPLFEQDDTPSLKSFEEGPAGDGVYRHNTQKYTVKPSFTESYSEAYHKSWKRFQRQCAKTCKRENLWRLFMTYVVYSYLVLIALPCAVLANVLYYHFGSDALDFIPSQTRIAWWLNFIARQVVTLELSRLMQVIWIDGCMLGAIGVKWLGALPTFLVLRSKGWPFILSMWGLLDTLLMQGNNRFQRNWLYWTGIEFYNRDVDNEDVAVLATKLYWRILLAMMFTGVAAAIKRTVFAIRFRRRQFREFKPRLESILRDIVLVSEVAMLAAGPLRIDDFGRPIGNRERIPSTDLLWSSTAKSLDEDASDRTGIDENGSNNSLDESTCPHNEDDPTRLAPDITQTNAARTAVREKLDSWHDPLKNIASDATLEDLLKFRHILTYLDETHPFGSSFGPAKDRMEMIDSSHSVFYRLLSLSPGEHSSVPFDTISKVAINDDGDVDDTKTQQLLRLFRSNIGDELTLLQFVQSIDTVYKSLRYFRASVANSSVIDNVLEAVVNAVFYFVLALLVMLFLQLNPWQLLVSISSLLVSVSFAMGSSVSKYVEGALLIVLRRPFDLGDRIFITEAESSENPDHGAGWFVEEIK